MKKIIMTSLVLVLFSQVQARQNPFVETNSYKEEVSRFIDQEMQRESKEVENIQEEEYIRKYQEKAIKKADDKEETSTKIEKKQENMYSQKEVNKLIKKAQIQSEIRAKRLIKKELKKVKVNAPTQQIVYVKPRKDVFEDEIKVVDNGMRKKLLSFLSIDYNNDEITINTKYDVIKKFSIPSENKIIVDYRANKSFYTKKENLNSKNFKKIAVGTHKKQRYFRVVIKLANKPHNYNVYKNDDGLITISSNKM